MQNHSGLPSRPRIPKHWNVVPMPDGRIQVRSAHKTVLLGGKSVSAVGKLLSLLDGTRQLPDILAEFPDIPASEVLGTLRRLAERGLVEAAPDPEAAGAGDGYLYGAQKTLFQLSSRNSAESQETLAKSRVAVFGLGGVGSWAVLALARAGIGGITGVDPGVVERSLPAVSALYRTDDVGQDRATALGERLREAWPSVQYTAAATDLGERESVTPFVARSSLALVCMDTPEVAAYRAVNAASLEAGVPWLRAAVDGFEAQLGPTVIPGETACYSCYELRSRANWPYYDENAAFEDYLASERPRIDYGGLSSIAGLIGNLAALEVTKLLAGFMPPLTTGKFITFHVVTLDYQSHDVLKLPRCPSCSVIALRPKALHWSLEEA
ncbi:MAG: TOMM precursor leader peptide-binding protein [Bacillota bacterium]